MKIVQISSAVLACGALLACGGSGKPAVDPAPVPAPAQEQKVSLDSAVDRYSYALGMDLGKAIANINVPLKMDVLMLAIQDEVDPNRPVLLSDSASESALQDLLLAMQKQKEADEKAIAQKALDEQVAFLAKNIQDSTVKVTPKGVQYRVLKEGTGIVPKASDKVQVHYIGALLDGSQFDNSVARGEPLEFPVSAVIEGWQDLLQVMKEGEKVKAWIPSELAYGAAGVPPMIPGNSLLIFEVELLKVYAEGPADSAVAPADSAASAATADTAAAAEPAKAAPADSAAAATAPAAEAKPAADTAAVKTAEPAKAAEPVKAEAAKEAAKPAADSAAPAAKPEAAKSSSEAKPAAAPAKAAEPAKK